MTNTFAVHLGGGAYLDASGKIVFGAPSGAQIYQAPGGFHLPVDAKQLQDTFKDLSDILPYDEAAKKKWMAWGVSENMVNFLGKVAGIVGNIASAIAIYAWGINTLTKLMGLVEEKMTPDASKAFSDITKTLLGQEEIDRATHLIKLLAPFEGAVEGVSQLLGLLLVENTVGAARAQIFKDMQEIVRAPAGLSGTPLSELLNQPWTTTYNSNAYQGRAFTSSLLVFERSDGSLAPVPLQSPNVTVFDYRLGVPMLLYGATTFTALIQIAMPWFRSAGIYAGQLRTTANAIDRFLLRMQDESISRTEYTPTTAHQQHIWSISDLLQIGGTHYYPHSTYAVGAFDLVRYDDAFLWGGWRAESNAGEDTGQRGLFNYRWHMPGYTPITSHDFSDVAEAANGQARQDYTNLQIATGMFRLISTAAWLRFLSTPPDRSQTVFGLAGDSRVFRDEAPTTAKSPSISASASSSTPRRSSATTRAIASASPPRSPATCRPSAKRSFEEIHSAFANGGWHNHSYVGDVWRPDYEPTQGDSRCKRLKTELRQNSILSEVGLYEGPSPSQAVTLGGHESLQATTFDWYVPVLPWSPYVDIATKNLATEVTLGGGNKTMLGTGGVSLHLMGDGALAPPPPMQVMGGPAPLVASKVEDYPHLDELTALYDASLDKAERRHVKIEHVKVEWQLNWTAEKLEVRLLGRPEDRPFQVHVVVEETVYSGETPPENIADILSDEQLLEQLHTPFVAEMVNQLVFVPEEFFRKEREALEQNAKNWRQFERRYAERGPIGPGDPIEFLQESIRELATRSSSTAILAKTYDMRVEFATHQEPELWDAVLLESQRHTAAS